MRILNFKTLLLIIFFTILISLEAISQQEDVELNQEQASLKIRIVLKQYDSKVVNKKVAIDKIFLDKSISTNALKNYISSDANTYEDVKIVAQALLKRIPNDATSFFESLIYKKQNYNAKIRAIALLSQMHTPEAKQAIYRALYTVNDNCQKFVFALILREGDAEALQVLVNFTYSRRAIEHSCIIWRSCLCSDFPWFIETLAKNKDRRLVEFIIFWITDEHFGTSFKIWQALNKITKKHFKVPELSGMHCDFPESNIKTIVDPYREKMFKWWEKNKKRKKFTKQITPLFHKLERIIGIKDWSLGCEFEEIIKTIDKQKKHAVLSLLPQINRGLLSRDYLYRSRCFDIVKTLNDSSSIPYLKLLAVMDYLDFKEKNQIFDAISQIEKNKILTK